MFDIVDMEVQLFSGPTLLGIVKAAIIDESMGVIGGVLLPNNNYFIGFQSSLRKHNIRPDWNQLGTFELLAFTQASETLKCEGGICITDVEGNEEISVEFCGLSALAMAEFRRH